MGRAIVRKSGKVGTKRAYTAVSKNSLVKVDGMQGVLDGIAERLDNLEIGVLKDAWITASKPLVRNVKQNISALPVGSRTKEVLQATLSISRGPDNKANVLVGMSQGAGVKRLPGRFILNPYWVEFGTAERVTKNGRRTGRIKVNPFFRPGVTASRAELRAALASEFKALLVEE